MIDDLKLKEVMAALYEAYPEAKCELDHGTPFELLVATILSAQTTDKKVNQVTAKMFLKYNTPEAFAALAQETLEGEIKEIGLYRNKAKNIISMSRMLLSNYGGEVPRDKEELIKLDGVGTKTANVVVSNAFGTPAMAVDTHVFRITNRIGIVKAATVEKTEEQLMVRIPRQDWILAHHTFIFHGRYTCVARAPKCDQCRIAGLCEYRNGLSDLGLLEGK